MSFTVTGRGDTRQLRSQAFIAHARVGVAIYVIVAVLVVAVLPTLRLPQFLAALILIPLIWNQWWRRGWFLALDDAGLTEVLNREKGITLRWAELRGFRVVGHMAPSNLLFIGRGPEHACFVIEALPVDGGEPQILWSTAGYGEAVAQPHARQDAEEIAVYLEARRAEAAAAARS